MVIYGGKRALVTPERDNAAACAPVPVPSSSLEESSGHAPVEQDREMMETPLTSTSSGRRSAAPQ